MYLVICLKNQYCNLSKVFNSLFTKRNVVLLPDVVGTAVWFPNVKVLLRVTIFLRTCLENVAKQFARATLHVFCTLHVRLEETFCRKLKTIQLCV